MLRPQTFYGYIAPTPDDLHVYPVAAEGCQLPTVTLDTLRLPFAATTHIIYRR